MRHSGIKSLHTVLPSTWISFYDVLKKINMVKNKKKYSGENVACKGKSFIGCGIHLYTVVVSLY